MCEDVRRSIHQVNPEEEEYMGVMVVLRNCAGIIIYFAGHATELVEPILTHPAHLGVAWRACICEGIKEKCHVRQEGVGVDGLAYAL